MSSSKVQRAFALLAFAACVVAFGLHARSYFPFFVDDAFISLRYSWRLLHGSGLTWTDGERIEGYSNFLWTVLISGLGIFGHDLVSVARGLGIACTVSVFAALFVASQRDDDGWPSVFFASMSALMLAAAGPIAAWSIGGLEQPLIIALCAWSLTLGAALFAADASASWSKIWPVSLTLGLLCLTRPDGAIFTVAALCALPLVRGFSWTTVRAGLLIGALPALLTLGQLLFRRVYYEDWVPNTYHVKGSFTWARFRSGADYVTESADTLMAFWVAIGLALLVVLFRRDARRRMLWPLLACAFWTLYVARIGGDICPQRRHLVVTFVLAAFLLLELSHWLWKRRSRTRFGAFLIGPLLLCWTVVAQKDDPQRTRALHDGWHWSGAPVGRMLRRAFRLERPLLAVDAAGALPYYYRLPCLDMLGLTDRHIATHPPPGIGAGYVGHEFGDGKYVASRKPDLIAFWTERPQWRSGHEMVRLPSFRRDYRLVTFETKAPSRTRTRLWVRARDGRIGIEESNGRVTVPAFLLQGRKPLIVRPDPQGRLFVALDSADPAAWLRKLRLSEGVWTISFEGSGVPAVTVRQGSRVLSVDDHNSFVIESPGAGKRSIDIELRASPTQRIELRKIVIERRQG